MKTLSKKEDIGTIEVLFNALKDGNDDVRKNAVQTLSKMEDRRALEPLIFALKDKDWEVKTKAAEALDKIDPDWPKSEAAKRQVPEFFEALKYGNSGARMSAANVLGKIGDARAVKPLISALLDKDKDVRSEVAEALKTIYPDWRKTKDARNQVLELIKAMRDNDWYIQMGAAWALGEIGDIRAIEPMISFLNDRDPKVREQVSKTLDGIVKSNLPFLESYPHLFCTECFLRAKKGSAKSGFLKSYNYVTCRCCGSTLCLFKDIEVVIGMIGGDIKDYVLNRERAYVKLWFESEKKTRNADIDVLEISESSETLSYDWAINAVLIELKNDVSRPGKYVKDIQVVIRGNPPISDDSIKILRHEFGEVINVC